MIYTDLTKRAMKICFDAHKEQLDKSNMPYVFHPFHLAEQMKDERTTVVALLHDVIEDSEYTLEDLIIEGFDEEIIEAIKCMTHNKDEEYMDYVRIVKENDIARIVKIEDLKHNMDVTRLDNVADKDLERVKKYRLALEYLEK